MRVSRNASNSRNFEIKIGNFKPSPWHKCKQKATQASIRVDWNIVFKAQSSDSFNVINTSVREGRG